MNKRLLLLLAIAGFLGCKAPSVVTADYGVNKGDDYFSIAVLPDIQYYTSVRHGGTMQMFQNQVNWVINNREKEKIAYVIQLGDITDHDAPEEWDRAKNEFYKFDDKNIPYGLAIGNHDQTPNGNPSKGEDNTYYSKYFGRDHFAGRSWYGGAMGSNNNNDNHFDLISANGDQYLIIYFVFNQPGHASYSAGYEKQTMAWGDSILSAYNDRKVIVVAHNMLGYPKGSVSGAIPGKGTNHVESQFTKQGEVIYNMAKKHNNVFLMLCGHVAGEGIRKDVYNGHVIKSYLSDYQSRQNAPYSGAKDRNGGNGVMRLMRINKTRQTLSVITFAPQANGSVIKEEDGDSQFTEPLFK
ncbi:MAG: metallophosphoesterase [Niabella sp.]